MNMSGDLTMLVSKSLRTLLFETMFRAEQSAYLLNPGDPGFIETLKGLSAETVSRPPRRGGKPIVAHANHVLFGWELIVRALDGDPSAFATADWSVAWQLERVDDREWRALLERMEKAAKRILEFGNDFPSWDEVMFTGMYGSAAHTAYHLGAIRQMIRDVS
jgi:hypothetical protein